MEPKKRKKQTSKNTSMQNLSSTEIESQYESVSFSNIEQKVFDEINNEELKKALNVWEKQFKFKEKVHIRDLNILKDIIGEYLNSFLLFGYNVEDERVIIQKFETSRDRDAIMEFLKTIFIKQQTDNFLD
jgi:Ni,Fe-hydrogenase I large subunit